MKAQASRRVGNAGGIESMADWPRSLRWESLRTPAEENGRGGEIRTHDLLYPKQARYQATLRPDEAGENADCPIQLQSRFLIRTLFVSPTAFRSRRASSGE